MNVREAERGDRSDVKDIAKRSFQASYSLSPDQIEKIVETVFAEDEISERVDDPDVLLSVAEEADGDDILGFADVDIEDEEGVLQWLHVDPDARGRGVGTRLVERIGENLNGRNLSFTASVIKEAREGGEFLEQFGLQQEGSSRIGIGGETFFVHRYSTNGEKHEANEPKVEVPRSITIDGDELLVDGDESIPATEAPFFSIYVDDSFEQRHGYFCSNCGGTDVAADGLDRLECGDCGNIHLADEWDAAYL